MAEMTGGLTPEYGKVGVPDFEKEGVPNCGKEGVTHCAKEREQCTLGLGAEARDTAIDDDLEIYNVKHGNNPLAQNEEHATEKSGNENGENNNKVSRLSLRRKSKKLLKLPGVGLDQLAKKQKQVESSEGIEASLGQLKIQVRLDVQ